MLSKSNCCGWELLVVLGSWELGPSLVPFVTGTTRLPRFSSRRRPHTTTSTINQADKYRVSHCTRASNTSPSLADSDVGTQRWNACPCDSPRPQPEDLQAPQLSSTPLLSVQDRTQRAVMPGHVSLVTTDPPSAGHIGSLCPYLAALRPGIETYGRPTPLRLSIQELSLASQRTFLGTLYPRLELTSFFSDGLHKSFSMTMTYSRLSQSMCLRCHSLLESSQSYLPA